MFPKFIEQPLTAYSGQLLDEVLSNSSIYIIDEFTNEPISHKIDEEIVIKISSHNGIQIDETSEISVVNGKVVFHSMTILGESDLKSQLTLTMESKGEIQLLNSNNSK